jgi:hypothetical protein
MSLTGGELNKLNGKYGISAPNKSVPIIKLIRLHKPKSREELVRLVKEHSIKKCGCGIVSQGSIEDFGKNLYDAQIKEWEEYKYSLHDCIEWEYNLFIIQSLKGNLIEEKAKKLLSKTLNEFKVSDANDYYDEELRIDLEIISKEKTIAGIQIKPSSYKYVRKNVQFMNTHRNSLVDFKVFYLYYDYDTEDFLNVEEISKEIEKLI